MDATTTGAIHAGGHAASSSSAATVARVEVKPDVFLEILSRLEAPLVFVQETNLLVRRYYSYVVLFAGFVVKSGQWEPLELPAHVEAMPARWIR